MKYRPSHHQCSNLDPDLINSYGKDFHHSTTQVLGSLEDQEHTYPQQFQVLFHSWQQCIVGWAWLFYGCVLCHGLIKSLPSAKAPWMEQSFTLWQSNSSGNSFLICGESWNKVTHPLQISSYCHTILTQQFHHTFHCINCNPMLACISAGWPAPCWMTACNHSTMDKIQFCLK